MTITAELYEDVAETFLSILHLPPLNKLLPEKEKKKKTINEQII